MPDLCDCDGFVSLSGDWCDDCDHAEVAHAFGANGRSWCEYDYNPSEDDL